MMHIWGGFAKRESRAKTSVRFLAGKNLVFDHMMDIAGSISIKDFVTSGCAVLGAVLGVMNTWNGLNRQKVKLWVVPKVVYPVGYLGVLTATRCRGGTELQTAGCIEITNLSAFPVIIYDTGFTLGGDPRKRARRTITKLTTAQEVGAWPYRLEPRESVSVSFKIKEIPAGIKKAYARTNCGEVGYGDNQALRTIRKQASVID